MAMFERVDPGGELGIQSMFYITDRQGDQAALSSREARELMGWLHSFFEPLPSLAPHNQAEERCVGGTKPMEKREYVGVLDAALWLVRHVREPLELSLQECFERVTATAELLNNRLRTGPVWIRNKPDQFADEGIMADLAAAMQRQLFDVVQALPVGFELRVTQESAMVEWFELESGKTICLDDAISLRPE